MRIGVLLLVLPILDVSDAALAKSAKPKFFGLNFYPLGRVDKSVRYEGLFFGLMAVIEKI